MLTIKPEYSRVRRDTDKQELRLWQQSIQVPEMNRSWVPYNQDDMRSRIASWDEYRLLPRRAFNDYTQYTKEVL